MKTQMLCFVMLLSSLSLCGMNNHHDNDGSEYMVQYFNRYDVRVAQQAAARRAQLNAIAAQAVHGNNLDEVSAMHNQQHGHHIVLGADMNNDQSVQVNLAMHFDAEGN
jgi:hypothetical protein